MKSFLTIVTWLTIAALAHAASEAPDCIPVDAVASFEFEDEAPLGWQMRDGWAFSAAGATASDECKASWQGDLPDRCLIEMIFDLPDTDHLAQGATVSLVIGSDGDPQKQIVASAEYAKGDYEATVSAPGADGKAKVQGTTKRFSLRGWAERTVSLGLAVDTHNCRLFVNGSFAAEVPAMALTDGRVSLTANNITLRAVRVLPPIPNGFVCLSGEGMALLNGGGGTTKADGVWADTTASVGLAYEGVPLLPQAAGEGKLAVLNVSAERWQSADWSEGTGMLTMPVPPRLYSAAYVLIHDTGLRGHRVPAMGFGLRVHERSAADLKNIYVGDVPVRCSDEGVSVRPVPELGRGWYLARVQLNPAALQWYTHDTEGNLLPSADASLPTRPQYSGSPFARGDSLLAYAGRTWTIGGGLPHPDGPRSSLQVAAITLEESGIDLTVKGNGLGNVYSQPDEPYLTGIVRNFTQAPITVRLTRQVLPFERPSKVRRSLIKLGPGETQSFDALAAPITERGHFRVRVVADAGQLGRIDYRTNVALLAPDTRKKIDSPFGCWAKLWEDFATEEQRAYLKAKAGVSFLMDKHNQPHSVGSYAEVPDEATAEAIAKSIGPDVRIFMMGWELSWSMEQTFVLPGVISEGRPEVLAQDIGEAVDRVAAGWRRLAAAIRKYRPDVKISLGNSGVNWSVPLLERGFAPGVEFDYFGTEEGLFAASPERPADAIGNVNWWVKAVCEHFGFEDVPIFHSEAIYLSTGPGFSRMAERTQAGRYVRAYLLGFPYDSIFGLSGAMIDSSNRYIYSLWGASAYCNQAPECSPKLSYVAYATLTQLLDGTTYEDKLATGTTSLYALRFRQPDGTALYAIWNLRGRRHVNVRLAAAEPVEVLDAFNRPVKAPQRGRELLLEASDLPLYLRGAEIAAIEPGPNLDERLPERILLNSLDRLSDWTVDTEADTAFEAPGEWTGVPKVMGGSDIACNKGLRPPGTKARGALTFTLRPLSGKHGLIPRYVSLSAQPGKEIPIPAGTTELGVWVYGNSTWAELKLGVENEQGDRRLLLADDRSTRMTDNFDGWRFLRTGDLGSGIASGSCKVNRIVVTMPEQQVYVDELLTTSKPHVAVWGLYAICEPPPSVNYLPW